MGSINVFMIFLTFNTIMKMIAYQVQFDDFYIMITLKGQQQKVENKVIA